MPGRRDVKVLKGRPAEGDAGYVRGWHPYRRDAASVCGIDPVYARTVPTGDPQVTFCIDCHPIGTGVGDLGHDPPVGNLASSLVKAESVYAMCRGVYVVKGCAVCVPRQAD